MSGPSRLPSALERWPEIEARLAGREPALFLDYDGTLSPIAPRPELATLPAATRDVLARLAARRPVAILSGRGLDDVRSLVNLGELYYAGSHGFDIAGPGGFRHEVGEGWPARIDALAEQLREELAGIPGVLVEPKRFALAVHFRLVPDEHLPAIERAVDRAAARFTGTPGVRKTGGKKVFELRPDLDWDKGRALLFLLAELGLDRPDVLPVYLGDDATDEDAFAALARRPGGGLGILIADEPRPTAAEYVLRDPGEARELLERLAARDAAAARPEAWPPFRPGEVAVLGPFAVPGLAPRRVRVYLPSDFDPRDPRVPRPALYMFDGQNVFADEPSYAGGWHLHEAVERLARAGRPGWRAPIVVGVDHGGKARHLELSPFPFGKGEQDGGRLEELLGWILGTLRPRLAARLPLAVDPAGTFVGGSSMGGLAALYAHFRHPEAFGGALVMSPSFWVADAAILEWVAGQPAPAPSRVYLDCGVREGRGTLLPLVAAMAAHLASRGYDADTLMFRPDAKGTHSERSWRRRLPKALRFLYR
jgi:trehalose-phosphatase